MDRKRKRETENMNARQSGRQKERGSQTDNMTIMQTGYQRESDNMTRQDKQGDRKRERVKQAL